MQCTHTVVRVIEPNVMLDGNVSDGLVEVDELF